MTCVLPCLSVLTVYCVVHVRVPHLGLIAQRLDSCHHLRRLIVACIAELQVQEMFCAMLLSTEGNWSALSHWDPRTAYNVVARGWYLLSQPISFSKVVLT